VRHRIIATAVGAVAAAGLGAWLVIKKGSAPIVPPKAAPKQLARAPKANAPDPTGIARWQIQYDDSAIGQVTGEAFIDWERQSGRVELRVPGMKDVRDLTVQKMRIDRSGTNPFVAFDLEGTSPAVAPTESPKTEGLVSLSVTPGSRVTAKPEDPELSAAVRAKASAEADHVHLAMSADPLGSLHGYWSYRADPLTERDANGSGRVGWFSLRNEDELKSKDEGFVGVQTAMEIWTPLPPQIAAAAVI